MEKKINDNNNKSRTRNAYFFEEEIMRTILLTKDYNDTNINIPSNL
jgi:hypothetical protein